MCLPFCGASFEANSSICSREVLPNDAIGPVLKKQKAFWRTQADEYRERPPKIWKRAGRDDQGSQLLQSSSTRTSPLHTCLPRNHDEETRNNMKAHPRQNISLIGHTTRYRTVRGAKANTQCWHLPRQGKATVRRVSDWLDTPGHVRGNEQIEDTEKVPIKQNRERTTCSSISARMNAATRTKKVENNKENLRWNESKLGESFSHDLQRNWSTEQTCRSANTLVWVRCFLIEGSQLTRRIKKKVLLRSLCFLPVRTLAANQTAEVTRAVVWHEKHDLLIRYRSSYNYVSAVGSTQSLSDRGSVLATTLFEAFSHH